MLKINYPSSKALLDFNKAYVASFSFSALVQAEYTDFKNSVNIQELPNTIEELLVLSFDSLAKIAFNLPVLSANQSNWVKKVFNYEAFQPNISSFFMRNQSEFRLSTCYYCNIDYVNAFKDIGDYYDGLDFVKRARFEDLIKIQLIGQVKARQIIASRNRIGSLDDLNLSSTIKDNLNSFRLKNEYNHFTLDHVLDKASHPIISLSLYNFVPSCYSCNSKFKKSSQFVQNTNNVHFSPSNPLFSFQEDVQFKIYFNNSKIKEILNIKRLEDFILDFEILRNEAEYANYIDILKLRGRYLFHKFEVIKLISKKVEYNDSQLDEISKIVKAPVAQVKADIFGEDLFNGTIESKPLTKFRRDIAKNIGIKGVI